MEIGIIVVLLLLSALFSGIEIAFVSSSKLYLEIEAKKGGPVGWSLKSFIRDPEGFISSSLFSNTITLTLYGMYMSALLDPFLQKNLDGFLDSTISLLLISTVISTLIVLLFGEFLPKSLFLISPERALIFFSLPINIFFGLISPLVKITNALAYLFITYILRQSYEERGQGYQIMDLRNLVNHKNHQNKKEEETEVDAQILTNAIDFKETRVRDCMVPRAEIIAVEYEDDIAELKEAIQRSGHSKIPVFEGQIDNVIGFCSGTALFKKPQKIEDIIQPIIFVPESMLASSLMMQFINERKSIALVVDEFGGTSGLITIEDVFEEIFGDINDEHDTQQWVEEQIDDNTWLLSARHEIEYLNDKYDWNLPEGDYDTLGGFILAIHEDIPEVNEIVETEGFRFLIVSKENNRLDAVRMTLLDMETDN